MKKLSIVALLFFLFYACFGQNMQIDSLKIELSKANSDTIKVLIYDKLMNSESQSKKRIEYGFIGLKLAKSIRYANGEILCGNDLGFLLVEQDFYRAIPILMEVKQLCERTNNQYELIRTLGFLGYAYDKFDFKKGRHYYHQCEKLMKKLKLSENVFPINNALGCSYKDHGDLDSALFYLQKGYKFALSSAKSPIKSTEFYTYFGEVYYRKGQSEVSLKYFRQSLDSLKNKPSGQDYLGIAKIFKDRKQQDSAKVYAEKSLEIEQNKIRNISIFQSANFLFELYSNENPAKALKYHLIASAAKDNLYAREKAMEVEKIAFDELENEARIKRRIEARQTAFENQIKIYGLSAVLFGLGLLAFFLYRNNKNKQKANVLLHQQKEEIDIQRNKAENALFNLKITQAQLIQKEKLASLGELTAGIAHEIQNPLNFVNNFSEVSIELIEELKAERQKAKGIRDEALEIELLDDLSQNQEKISHHGKRASSIVKGMLEHSRTNTGEKELTDINELADEYLRLSYHGLRAKNPSFQADYELIADKNLPKINVIPQEIGRVLLNLINNAFYVVNEKKQMNIPGYEPTVTVSTHSSLSSGEGRGEVKIRVKDNGSGIPEKIKEKIFQPFFTTKPTGEGTGLGLSLAYDIITKGHDGTLGVVSEEGKGAEFIVKLPIV